jgi:hypothetical protein
MAELRRFRRRRLLARCVPGALSWSNSQGRDTWTCRRKSTLYFADLEADRIRVLTAVDF